MAQEETFHYVRTLTLPFFERMCNSILKSKLRKHRRVVSLLMAIVMVFVFLSMTASAAVIDDPVITPKASTCPQCGGSGFTYWKTVYTNTKDYWEYEPISRAGCAAGPSTHVHYLLPADVYSRCSSCGYYTIVETERAYCPYGGIS